jgi:hypothetical protein
MKGGSELQSGAVLLLGSLLGFAALAIWGSSASPSGVGVVFTRGGFASAVAAIMLAGVFVIGAVLLALGAVLWIIGRAREAKRDSGGHRE